MTERESEAAAVQRALTRAGVAERARLRKRRRRGVVDTAVHEESFRGLALQFRIDVTGCVKGARSARGAGCVKCAGCLRCGKGRSDNGDAFDLFKRQERELQRLRGTLLSCDELPCEWSEAEHLDTDDVRAVGEASNAIAAVSVGCHYNLLVGLRCDDRRARNGKAVERHLAVLIARGEEQRTSERHGKHRREVNPAWAVRHDR